MSAFGDAFLFHLRTNLDAFLAIIEDIPTDDLNRWKPAMSVTGDQETNTFAALGIHIVGAAQLEHVHLPSPYVPCRTCWIAATMFW